MNCAFEDVRFLSTILDHFDASPTSLPPSPLPFSAVSPPLSSFPIDPSRSRLASALSAYTTLRAPSLSAIQQLAASNYAEMASSVLDPLYLLRLSLDGVLSRVFSAVGRGGAWESLYRMTTFRYELAYEEALRRRAWQGRVLEGVMGAGLAGVLGVGAYVAWGLRRGKW